MDPQDLVTGIRWQLLKLIAERPQPGAELARTVHTSAANVNQHLKLLELAGLVKKERVDGKSVHYAINHELALITHLSDKPVREVVLLDPFDSLHLRLFLDKSAQAKYLRKFLWTHEELVKGFLAFGVVKEDSGELQLLVLADDVKSLRKEYANMQLGDKKIVIWSHTPQEFTEGVLRKEHYFTDMLKRLSIIYDPKYLMQRLKEEPR